MNNLPFYISPLRYWVQQALPTVFDDSLSYTEVLGKISKSLNDVISATNMVNSNLVSEYNDIKHYKAGEYVWYNTNIYKCIADTYGPFDTLAWKNVTDEGGSFITSVSEDLLANKNLINNAIEGFDYVLKNAVGSIAETYNADKFGGYHVGDYVTYEGTIYECQRDTSGEFNSEDWESIILIDNLRSYVEELVTEEVGLNSEFTGSALEGITQNSLMQVLSKLNSFPILFFKGIDATGFTWDGYECEIEHTGDASSTVICSLENSQLLVAGNKYFAYVENDNSSYVSIEFIWYDIDNEVLSTSYISESQEFTVPNNSVYSVINLKCESGTYNGKFFGAILNNDNTNNTLKNRIDAIENLIYKTRDRETNVPDVLTRFSPTGTFTSIVNMPNSSWIMCQGSVLLNYLGADFPYASKITAGASYRTTKTLVSGTNAIWEIFSLNGKTHFWGYNTQAYPFVINWNNLSLNDIENTMTQQNDDLLNLIYAGRDDDDNIPNVLMHFTGAPTTLPDIANRPGSSNPDPLWQTFNFNITDIPPYSWFRCSGNALIMYIKYNKSDHIDNIDFPYENDIDPNGSYYVEKKYNKAATGNDKKLCVYDIHSLSGVTHLWGYTLDGTPNEIKWKNLTNIIPENDSAFECYNEFNTKINYWINLKGQTYGDISLKRSAFLPIRGNTDYYTIYQVGSSCLGGFYDVNKSFLIGIKGGTATSAQNGIEVTEIKGSYDGQGNTYKIADGTNSASINNFQKFYKFRSPENARYIVLNLSGTEIRNQISSKIMLAQHGSGDFTINKYDTYYQRTKNKKLCVIGPSSVFIDRWDRDGYACINMEYGNSSSSTDEPTTYKNSCSPETGTYIWARIVVVDVAHKTSYYLGTSVIADNRNGDIRRVDTQYFNSTSKAGQTGSGVSWKTSPDYWSANKYFWCRAMIEYYSTSNKDYSTPILVYKQAVYAEYGLSDNSSTEPTEWSNIPNIVENKTMWSRLCYFNNSNNTYTYTGKQVIINEISSNVSSVVPMYYKSTSSTSITGGTWGETLPDYSAETYYWFKTKIIEGENTMFTNEVTFGTVLVDNAYRFNGYVDTKNLLHNGHIAGFQEYLIPYYNDVLSLGYSGAAYPTGVEGSTGKMSIYTRIFGGSYGSETSDGVDFSNYDDFIITSNGNGLIDNVGVYYDEKSNEYSGVIYMICKKIIKENPLARICLVGFNISTTGGIDKSRREDVNEQLKLIAADMSLGYIDRNEFGEPNSFSRWYYLYDGTHLNNDGNKILAENIRKYLIR